LAAALVATATLVRDVRSFQPDLLHLHYAGGKLSTAATLSGVHPLAVTVMGGDVLPEQHPGGLSSLEKRATRRILEEADLILVKSDVLRAAVSRWGSFGEKVETVRWGVDTEVFRRDPEGAGELRRRFGLSPGDRVILSPRMVVPLYNVHLIVAAMPAVLDRVPQALLFVCEYQVDDRYRSSITRGAAGLGDRVRFVGRLDPREMPALYTLAEVVVSIPSSDGLPQTLFEAMACQTPIVLGRLPSYREVVADGQGALFADFDAESVAKAVVQLLVDGELCASLTSRALTRVKEVGHLPSELDRVESLYRDLLVRPRRRASPRLLLDAASLLFR
jgi:glycosyltransferase involved in cell wall biosynthesis